MSKIRLLKASPFYTNFTNSLYKRNSEIHTLSYEEQYRINMYELFGWSDFWKTHLENTGDFEVIEIISNNHFLQKQWARENLVNYREETLLQDVLLAQIEFYKPDVFFAHDYTTITNGFLELVKRKTKSIKLIIGWDGLRTNCIDFYKEWDMILTPSPESVDYYVSNGKKSYYFKLGFESSILKKVYKSETDKSEVSFVGSLLTSNNFHLKRFEFLGRVSGKLNLSLNAANFPTFRDKHIWHPLSTIQMKRLLSGKVKDWLFYYRLASINKGEIFGLSMYQKIYNSNITLNTHIDASGNYAGNMRLYEATGLGVCLITDWKKNIDEIFDTNNEIVCYKSPSEAISKVKELMLNDNLRKSIAEAGQKRTLKEYNLSKLIEEFSKYLIVNI
ncbi:MAG: glycosyltransferase [Hydrotalea sp.]|nr:glycosyltransferase [Hydrotalea sp.]